MDSTTGGVLGIFGFLASLGGLIYTAINHKRIRCRCCGKDIDMSVDVDSTVPPTVPDDQPGATAPTVPSVPSIPSVTTLPTSNRRSSIIDTSPTTNENENECVNESVNENANEVTKYEEYREDMYSKDLEPPRKKNKKSRVAPSD